MQQTNAYLYEIFNHWFRGGNIYVYSDPHFRDLQMYGVRYDLAMERYNRGEQLSDFEKSLIEIWSTTAANAPIEELLDQLDLTQVKSINQGLGKNDTIIFLGDMIEKDHIEEGLKYCSMIKGYKVLIKGNHDAGNSNYKRKEDEFIHMPKCPKCGSFDVNDGSTHIYSEHWYMSCNKCSYSEEFGDWQKSKADNHLFDEVYPGVLTISDKVILSHQPFKHEAIFNIHGHVHANGQCSGNTLNVSAEWIGYKPVSLLKMFKTGKFKNVSDIHRLSTDRAINRSIKYAKYFN